MSMEMDFSQVSLGRVIVHFVGSSNTGSVYASSPLELDESQAQALLRHWLMSFRSIEPVMHRFSEAQPPMGFQCLFDIFNAGLSLYSSICIAEALEKASVHPNIKSGHLYIVELKSVCIGDIICDCLGIFKTEDIGTYIKPDVGKNTLSLDSGTPLSSLEKGAIILNDEAEDGYRMFIFDKNKSKWDAKYWTDTFLCAEPVVESYLHTKNMAQAMVGFVADVFNEEHSVALETQIQVSHRAVKFLEQHEEYNEDAFLADVLCEPAVIDAFKEYAEALEAKPLKTFDIHYGAVQKSKKLFKSVLKLDNTFELKIKSEQGEIEQGYDEEKELNFYKIFFKVAR
jgi:hypothetical protein